MDVDWRIEMFEAAAKNAFGFLADGGVTVSLEHDLGHPPSRIAVRFENGTFLVEAELTVAAGTRKVTTFVRTMEGEHLVGPATAREPDEMGDVLKAQADEARVILDS